MRKSVLVLEDEAIVAMDLAAELGDAGWHVLGPAGSIPEAIRLIEAPVVAKPVDPAALTRQLAAIGRPE